MYQSRRIVDTEKDLFGKMLLLLSSNMYQKNNVFYILQAGKSNFHQILRHIYQRMFYG